METSGGLLAVLEADGHESDWLALLESHCSALFQMALLLSGDPQKAESAITLAIDNLDVCKTPRQDEGSELQYTVAMNSLRSLGEASYSSCCVNAESMLQSGLWLVLRVEPFARACFVLRYLVGYPASQCAEMMGVEEACIDALLVPALESLTRTDGR